MLRTSSCDINNMYAHDDTLFEKPVFYLSGYVGNGVMDILIAKSILGIVGFVY